MGLAVDAHPVNPRRPSAARHPHGDRGCRGTRHRPSARHGRASLGLFAQPPADHVRHPLHDSVARPVRLPRPLHRPELPQRGDRPGQLHAAHPRAQRRGRPGVGAPGHPRRRRRDGLQAARPPASGRAAARPARDHGGRSRCHRDHYRPRDHHRPYRCGRARTADQQRADRQLPHAARRGHRAVDRAGARRRRDACRGSATRSAVVADSGAMTLLYNTLRWLTDPAHWQGADGIPIRLMQHIQLWAEAVAIGALIALPIGIGLGHFGRFGNLAINISNAGRAVPSFAILVIAFQAFGLGDAPIILALTALAVPPMVTNSYVALREGDADIKEAARGMGYRELAQLVRVEIPLAVPLIMAGIRTSAVQVVATATLAALIAGGGFGRYIIDGFATQVYTKVLAGAILVAILALATELGLSALERVLTPRGLRSLHAPAARRATAYKTA